MLLTLHMYLNFIFLHFMLFVSEFHLIDEKETEVLDDLLQLLLNPPSKSGSTPTTPTDAQKTVGESPVIEGAPEDVALPGGSVSSEPALKSACDSSIHRQPLTASGSQ